METFRKERQMEVLELKNTISEIKKCTELAQYYNGNDKRVHELEDI